MPSNKSKTAADPFAELVKFFEGLKAPGVDLGIDMDAVIASRRKDMETLVSGNKMTFQLVQGLAEKQNAILKQAMVNAEQAMKADPSKGADMVRKIYETAVADMHDIADMTLKAQTELMETFASRAEQSLAELKAMVKQK